jgi:hypothetical protein
MNSDNSKVEEYFLMPTADLPIGKDRRIRISDRHFREFGYDDLGDVPSKSTARESAFGESRRRKAANSAVVRTVHNTGAARRPPTI